MPDISAIAGALSSLKVSTDLTKAALGLRDAELVREKVLELNAQIFSARESALEAQATQSALLEEIRDLKKQVADFESWNTEKDRYKLAQIGGGVFAYTIKPGMENGEPSHSICARCYEDRRKSILHRQERRSKEGIGKDYVAVCLACKSEIVVGFEPYDFGT